MQYNLIWFVRKSVLPYLSSHACMSAHFFDPLIFLNFALLSLHCNLMDTFHYYWVMGHVSSWNFDKTKKPYSTITHVALLPSPICLDGGESGSCSISHKIGNLWRFFSPVHTSYFSSTRNGSLPLIPVANFSFTICLDRLDRSTTVASFIKKSHLRSW